MDLLERPAVVDRDMTMILAALAAFNKGDGSVRLPAEWTGNNFWRRCARGFIADERHAARIARRGPWRAWYGPCGAERDR